MDQAILSLLSIHSLVILSLYESTQLSILNSRKDSLLNHQILTWKLKNRFDWINEGDANMKFFHSYASAKRNSKSIWGLQNQHGEMIEDIDQLKNLSVSHFSDLFSDDG